MKPQPDLEPTMPRVLVAEDDTLVRIAIAEALRDAGFRVMEAASADEALAYLEAAERVDLVFSDIQMPGSLDGFGLARRLRGRHPELPIILTSGNAARPDDMDGALFLPKPYDHQGLLQTRSEEHTSELQSLMRISYAVFRF